MSNSIGEIFRITSFGESHGPCVGVIVDGCPAGLPLEVEEIQREVDKRRPDPAAGQTARREQDRVEVLSGLFNGHTSGAPLGLLVPNQDIRSADYEGQRFLARPGHADYTAFLKHGGFNDYRGGGRFSGRVTVGLVMAGAVAKKLLATIGAEVLAWTAEIGGIKSAPVSPAEVRARVYQNPMRCPDLVAAERMLAAIEQARRQDDSLGGVIEGTVLNLPAGLGEPFFDSLEGQLARALFAIPAVKGVEFGAGFGAARLTGSQNNDVFRMQAGKVVSLTNQAGGILGGISSGMPLLLRVAVKPTPSIGLGQKTVDLQKREDAEIRVEGRHDACIVPRAVSVVESMVAVVLCDFALRAGIMARVIK